MKDAFGGDVHADFREDRTSGGAPSKNDKSSASHEGTVHALFGLDFVFFAAGALDAEKSSNFT